MSVLVSMGEDPLLRSWVDNLWMRPRVDNLVALQWLLRLDDHDQSGRLRVLS